MKVSAKAGVVCSALVVPLSGAAAAADTIVLVDFGYTNNANVNDAFNQTWNVTTSAQADAGNPAPMTNLQDIDGNTTTIDLLFEPDWANGSASAGGYAEHYTNVGGTWTSDGPGTGTAPELVAGLDDNFGIIRQAVPDSDPVTYDTTGAVTFTDLTPGATYTVEIAATIIGSSFSSYDYQVNGVFNSASGAASGDGFRPRQHGGTNHSANGYGAGILMTWADLTPNLDGELIITVHSTGTSVVQGPISVIRLTEVPEPATAGMLAMAGLAALHRRSRPPANVR